MFKKSKKNETLNFDEVNKKFNSIIYDNCKRNIFRKDNTFNYMNYKQLIYDFDEIEKHLGELLLPGKVKFNNTLKFVTFYFEGFRKNKSSILIVFEEKYKQITLSLEKKQLIYDFVKENYNGQTEELTKILFSIQLLIYYLIQVRQDEKEEIRVILDELPEYVNLSKECKAFLQNQKLKIKFEEIIDVYSFFEFLCYKPIINNLQVQYKEPIDPEVGKQILKLFDENKFNIITKENLASACRKFISRYLTSSRKDADIDEKKDLKGQISRFELWPKEIPDKEQEFYNELNYLNNLKDPKNEQNKIFISIGQCFELYNLIGCDEKLELRGIKEKKDEVKEEGYDNEDEEIYKFVIKRDVNKHRRRPRNKY